MTQEIQLVYRGASGTVIPTRDFAPLKAEAARLGPAACEAFNEQVARQMAALQSDILPTTP